MNSNTSSEYNGILPDDFFVIVKISAILGFVASLVLTSALVFKGVEKLVGPEDAKKYRWVVVVVDVAILFIFAFIYLIFF